MPYTQPGKPETMKPPESNAKHPSGCLQNRGHFIYRLRVLVKTLLRDHLAMGAISSYCRDCGRNVHDFDAPDWAWQQVWGDSGGVLCYDCFSERCHKLGIPPCWSLTNLRTKDRGTLCA